MAQSQVPEWLTNEVLSLPITTPQETAAAAFNSTQLNGHEPDPDVNQFNDDPIQVCYRVNS